MIMLNMIQQMLSETENYDCYDCYNYNKRDAKYNLIVTITSILDLLAAQAPQFNENCIFTSKNHPIILLKYIIRIHHYLNASECELIVAMIYIDRFIYAYERQFEYNILIQTTVHKIFATAMMLSQKYCEDKFNTLGYVSRVTCIPKDECINCELIFLQILDGRLFISTEEYRTYDTLLNNLIDKQFV